MDAGAGACEAPGDQGEHGARRGGRRGGGFRQGQCSCCCVFAGTHRLAVPATVARARDGQTTTATSRRQRASVLRYDSVVRTSRHATNARALCPSLSRRGHCWWSSGWPGRSKSRTTRSSACSAAECRWTGLTEDRVSSVGVARHNTSRESLEGNEVEVAGLIWLVSYAGLRLMTDEVRGVRCACAKGSVCALCMLPDSHSRADS